MPDVLLFPVPSTGLCDILLVHIPLPGLHFVLLFHTSGARLRSAQNSVVSFHTNAVYLSAVKTERKYYDKSNQDKQKPLMLFYYSLHLPHHLSFTHFQMYFNIYFTSWHYFFSEFRLSLIPYMQKLPYRSFMTPVRQSLYFSYNRSHALRATPLSRITSRNLLPLTHE